MTVGREAKQCFDRQTGRSRGPRGSSVGSPTEPVELTDETERLERVKIWGVDRMPVDFEAGEWVDGKEKHAVIIGSLEFDTRRPFDPRHIEASPATGLELDRRVDAAVDVDLLGVHRCFGRSSK